MVKTFGLLMEFWFSPPVICVVGLEVEMGKSFVDTTLSPHIFRAYVKDDSKLVSKSWQKHWKCGWSFSVSQQLFLLDAKTFGWE